ncbi:MAG: TIGR04283 family arsenosugar biosynthesis glycosyltransferase, partial [Flavobacteriales bacterium]
DNTYKIAKEEGAQVYISYNQGRAIQMNFGAWYAKNNILYFLHADSFPPLNFDKKIIKAVEDGHKGGCFRMTFNDDHWLLKCSCWFTRLKWNICNGGDQSLFVKRELFEKIKGYKESLSIFEDIDIIQKLKKRVDFYVIPSYITTSARRYRKNGVVKLQLLFALLHLFYFIGLSHEFIFNFYKNKIR